MTKEEELIYFVLIPISQSRARESRHSQSWRYRVTRFSFTHEARDDANLRNFRRGGDSREFAFDLAGQSPIRQSRGNMKSRRDVLFVRLVEEQKEITLDKLCG